MPARYALQMTSSGAFLFNLHASNGQIILTSGQFVTRTEAMESIASARLHCQQDDRFARLTASSGEPFFRLETPDGDLIGYSELYASATGRDAGIVSVKANGPGAPIEDES